MDGEKVERLRERFLQCPVCMDEFQDPRMLPCHHTICIDCINRILMSSATGRTFRCPQCRRDVCLPRGGTTELPVNFFIRSLQEELGEEVSIGPCQVCCRGTVPAQFRCLDCDLDLCRFCIHAHRLVTHRDNATVNILRMEVGGLPLSGATGNKNCSTHTEEIVQLFCETCQLPVCVRCSCGEHRKHHFLSLGEKLHGSRDNLQQQLEILMRERRGVKGWFRQLEAEEVEVKDNSIRTLADIQNRAQELHALVDRMTDAVKDKVRYRQQQQLTDISSVKSWLARLTQRLDLGISFLRSLQEGDVSLELLDAFSTFSAELEDLRRSSASNTAIPVYHQSFLLGRHLELKGCVLAKFGSLKARCSYLHFGNTQPPLLWKLSNRLTVWGVLQGLLVLSLLFTVIKLSVVCYLTPSDPDTYKDSMVALGLTAYLLLTALFAFRKAKLQAFDPFTKVGNTPAPELDT